MAKSVLAQEEELDFNDGDFVIGDDEQEEQDEVPERRAKKKKKKKVNYQALEQLALDAVDKLKDLGSEICDRVFEREAVVKDIMLALIAKENILLIGPPGTAKTLLAELVVQGIEDGVAFKWMMNRTTDPSDIVGPYSIKAMENDQFLRITTGRSPEAHVLFYDEIFKSNEPALNYLLSILNEGYFYNDGKQVKVARRLAIAASNELPDTEDLNAFFDRFIFRHWVDYVKDPQNRILMGRAAREEKNPTIKKKTIKTKLTLEEIDAMQKVVHMVEFPAMIEANYDRLIRDLNQNYGISVSDRRYYKGQVAMMAHALLNGRMRVNNDDFQAVTYILGNTKADIEHVEKEVGKYKNPHENTLKEYVKKAQEVHDKVFSMADNRTAMAGEAVTANATLQEILVKMEDEIKEARKAGVDTRPLEKMIQQVEDMMAKINEECLRKTQRAQRKW
jgi:MoxR-like ATPase